MQLMGSITTSQALGAKQTNLLLRGLRLARTHSSISCFAKKSGSSCWTHMVATDPFQYVPSTSCRCSAEGVGATLFIFKQPWHRPFSEAKKSVPTPQMSREPLSPPPRLPVWSECGPPRDCSALATNSWLYVPLLHAAAGEMGPEALLRWRTDPRAAWWEDARHTLAASCPVPVATLTEALLTATNAASERLPEHLLREAAALPTGASVHIGWVVRHLAQHHDGYISAPCQEACLELFGGRAFAAELDRASDAFRQAPPPERRTPASAPPVAAHPDRQPPGRPPSPDSHPEHTPPPAEPRHVPPAAARRSNLNQPIENREMMTTCWPQRRATQARLPHPVAPDVAAGDADAGAAPRRPLPPVVIRRLPLLARPRLEFRTSHRPARVPTRSASVPMPPPKPACASGLHPSMP